MPDCTLLDSVRCFECGEPVPYLSLDEHMIKSHGYIRCPHCDLIFNLYRLDEHICRYHKDSGKNYTDQTFKCAECGEAHLLDAHSKKVCPKCSDLIESNKLIEHIKSKHFYIECEVCGIFESPVMMDTHLEEAHGFKPCPRCGVAMDEKKLRSHIKNSH